MWWHDSGWGWLVMTVLMFAFWGAVIWGIVAVARGERPSAATSDPETLLAQRLAAGEIDEDEYRSRLDTLRSSRARPD